MNNGGLAKNIKLGNMISQRTRQTNREISFWVSETKMVYLGLGKPQVFDKISIRGFICWSIVIK